MRPAAALAERLGLPVRDLDLLQQALIHSSYLHEHRDLAAGHNERLEFLGDSVVSLAISDALYRRHPDDDEGVLSARRASIVSTTGLARLANRLGLGEYLLLGEGESQRGGRRRPGLLASAFEALVGAVYLDLGYEAASDFVSSLAAPELTSDRPLGALKSPKSRLQEFTQRLSGERPQYHVVDAVGPDHDKVFRVEVAVGGRVIGVGEGHSRRVAETAAAARAIETLRQQPGDLTEGAPELAEFDPDEPEPEPGPGRVSGTPASSIEASPDDEPWIELDIDILPTVPREASEESEQIRAEALPASASGGPAGRGRPRRERAAGSSSASTARGSASPRTAPDGAPTHPERGGRRSAW
jgi:ribonuclease-3